MDSIIKSIIEEVEKFHESIKDALDSKNISNTGEAANSLKIDYDEDSVQSIGIFYLEFLDTGRGYGKYVPIEPLQKWAITKFNVTDEEALSIAYAVSTKIYKLGTEIFRNKKEGIELDKKIVALQEALKPLINKSVKLQIKQKLNEFKNAFIRNKYQI